ncbi:MAG: hypothetical protein K2F78_10035 [Muribaculaceae bacterium]|nr:hypothetical protein [Muribaculaceae bacterium]
MSSPRGAAVQTDADKILYSQLASINVALAEIRVARNALRRTTTWMSSLRGALP